VSRTTDACFVEPTTRRAACAIVAAAALLFLVRLGATGLWAPDEPRYGQIAEELRSGVHGARGVWLLHLNGEPYTQKPPLYYWLAATGGAPLGRVTETAARLPSALAGVALVALTMRFGTRLLGPAGGICGAALLLTTFEFAEMARSARLDVLLALFEALALAAFWRLDRGIGARRRSQLVLHGALGLAVLTKGPVGFLVPALVIASFLGWEGRLRQLGRAFPAWGLLLSIGPGLVWIAGATALAPPGFFDEAVRHNLVDRFWGDGAHARPFHYYLYQFPVGFLPWVLLAPLVWIVARREIFAGSGSEDVRRSWRLLLAWVGATLVFFSLSTGKRSAYVLTCHPAAALLVADALVRQARATGRLPPLYRGVAAALGATLLAGGLWLVARDPLHDPGASLRTALGLAVALGGAAAARVLLARARAPLLARGAVPVALVYATLLLLFVVTWPARDPEKSPRALAEAAAALTPGGRPIGLVGDRALAGGLAYYGGRRVELLGSRPQIARFFADGGAALVVQARKLERVEAVAPVDVRFRAREGRRELVVVTPRRARDG
jgi:4-amino-4-deoxy-L-arabinose transferase-like glycosyltransferase